MFLAVNMASAGIAAAGSLTIVYPLDYARTRLASDVGSDETFDGLFVCLEETNCWPQEFLSPLRWFRRVPLRNHPVPCFQLGAFDTIVRLNPWKYDIGMITSPPRLRRHKQPSFGRRYTHSCREIFGILHVVDLLRVHRDTSRPTLRSRSPCASWAPSLSGVCAGKPLALLALHLSAREGCPGHCDTLTGGTLFIPYGSEKLP